MSLPFQCLSRLGRGALFCAAKGCSIQTFDLAATSQPLFSWTHPFLQQTGNANQAKETHEGLDEGEQAGQQPPSKRRKLSFDDVESNVGTGDKQEMLDTPGAPADEKKGQKRCKAKWMTPKPELPFVVLLTATEDGSHVIAVTGQDKTLWVFEHDGKGLLREVSQRAMPKRPCSLALTTDGQTILSADKFGDVYALPLIPQPDTSPESAPAPVPASSQALRGANVFTVHSQRNRRALEDQKRQREANAKRDVPKEGPKFAHEVLLGHVSMLTCVLTTNDSQSRPYIVTADRDEHIRVSRGMPQSHVIETYCLGHASFVTALCNPRSTSDILISGGGDNELFVWDWLAGKLLGTVDLLVHAREVLPDTTKIAVVKLIAYEVENECFIVAICERIPALFVFQLQADNTVLHRETLKLRGNALDIASLDVEEEGLLVAVDVAGDDGEVLAYQRDGNSWAPRQHIQGTADAELEPILSREDLDKVLYTVESLRKTGLDEGDDEGPPEVPGQSSETKQNS
ncbi:hypothetical protein GQX73_g2692 [Xylaria multiplex]|uniref:Uncharacterized protein n=1 Tax=Xylaria multiplex TaxID=323545 RepID=A0A7C8IVB3_9PEZI|nr:hypothetical protein GQX73_g2692 [Xylaria multiplex]